MKVQPLTELICPLDGAALANTSSGVRCPDGHVFDRAREGYLNLLPVQHKASRDPGDDQTMVAARRRILDDGLFAPLADAVFESVREFAGQTARVLRVVDAGCGEGYYLAQLLDAAQLCPDPTELLLAGYDISKWAVRGAARRTSDISWVVASNRQPPFAPASIDLLLSLFGFPHWPSFERIVAPEGGVLLVEPGAEHLLELRKIIYPQVTPVASSEPREALARGWRQRHMRPIDYTVELTSAAQIQSLLAMTPHGHRMNSSGREALARLDRMQTTISVVLRVLVAPRQTAGCEQLAAPPGD
jgi:23S rRNA (guanine745-N1)-methyltransferase